MTKAPSAGELIGHLVGDASDPVSVDIGEWLEASARFRAFVGVHRDKIRKKLRTATDADARLDVRTELGLAYHLLADGSLELAFEAYGSRRSGPDYTVSSGGRPSFNLEVTRLRRTAYAAAGSGPLVTKLRQLPPSIANVVLLAIEGETAEALDVGQATRLLRARADAADDGFFTGRGLEGVAGFNRRIRRLGAVLVWCEGGSGEARAVLWRNPSARIPVPDRSITAAVRCLRAAS